MKNRLLGIMLMLLTVLTVQAQNSMSDINRIKRNKSFLYGEATLDQKEAALKLAYELLEAEIKNWAQQKSADISSVIATHIRDYADTIILARGSMIRAFAYVKTSDLKSVKGKEREVKVQEAAKALPAVEEAVPTDIVVEEAEAKVETVPVEATPKTEPVAVEPVREETAKVVPSVTETKPTGEMPAVPETKPVVEEEKPVVDESPVAAPAVKTAEELVIEKLLTVTSFYDLEKTMKPLKDAGLITGYGKYTTMTDPASCFLIIYDQQAAVKAVLGKGTTTRRNLKTGQADSEKNYHGCGALWFKLKE